MTCYPHLIFGQDDLVDIIIPTCFASVLKVRTDRNVDYYLTEDAYPEKYFQLMIWQVFFSF